MSASLHAEGKGGPWWSAGSLSSRFKVQWRGEGRGREREEGEEGEVKKGGREKVKEEGSYNNLREGKERGKGGTNTLA